MNLFDGSIPFDLKQKKKFKMRLLQDEWTEKYHQIFDQDDLRLAKSQPAYHFFEWLAVNSHDIVHGSLLTTSFTV
jgi:hypothetical protein